MKTREIEQNIKLGIFVLVGLVLFLITVFFIGSENNVFNRTFTAYAVFKNVEGLKDGDNVWLSGVKIGTVKNVAIVAEGKVIVTLSLKDKQNQFIKKNATAFVGSDGLVGNKIVVVRPGDSPESIHDNDTIGAFSPTDTQELINIARDVGENTRALTADLKELTRKINEGEGIVGELLHEGQISKDLRSAVDKMRATASMTSNASGELYSVMYKLNNGDGLINKLSTDTTMVTVFNQTLDNVRQVGKNSAEMSRSLATLIDKFNSGDNALGVLMADTTFASKLRETLDNAESASAKLDENMEALKHNFFLRGYFRKKEKQEKKKQKEEEEMVSAREH
jgi:phospholipid/cholesterol/gamma-HCH transport system substrate-binding protein